LLLVLLVLFVEVGRAVTGLVVNGDDSDYCAQATTALYTNSINHYEPQTGTPMAPLDQIEPHHKISLWANSVGVHDPTGRHPSGHFDAHVFADLYDPGRLCGCVSAV